MKIHIWPFGPEGRISRPRRVVQHMCRTLFRIRTASEQVLTTTRRAMLDTGAQVNLISEQALVGTGYQVTPASPGGTDLLQSIGRAIIDIKVIGTVDLTWHVRNKPHKEYTDIFVVIAGDAAAEFDALLGRHWLEEHKAFKRNKKILCVWQRSSI